MAQNNPGSSMKSYNENQGFSPRTTYREESSTKVPDLLHDLDQKNSEIVFLNKRIQDLEKQKNEMFLDLEKYENDYQISERKFQSKENELTDKINILEMEVRKLKIFNFLNSKIFNLYSKFFILFLES